MKLKDGLVALALGASAAIVGCCENKTPVEHNVVAPVELIHTYQLPKECVRPVDIAYYNDSIVCVTVSGRIGKGDDISIFRPERDFDGNIAKWKETRFLNYRQ